ncbi:MAG: orotidine-5'-phosphate decarboxylase [Caldilineaceae bacterium]
MKESFFEKLERSVAQNQSLLCVGLDPLPEQIPDRYRQGTVIESILAWNRAVIEATHDLVCCYKPNIAFYEALGIAGMQLLKATLALIPSQIPVILDVKRSDMGNTQVAYARACFDELGVDAVTLAPYLGRDSVDPFTRYQGKAVFVLCHTSNPSAGDFQHLEINDWRMLDRESNQPLYIHVARTATQWSPNVGLVVGATYPDAVAAVRQATPDAWFLVPGIGAQGGDLAATLQAGLRSDGKGLIISASRSICQAEDHRQAALELRDQINAEGAKCKAEAGPSSNPQSAPKEDIRRNPQLNTLLSSLHSLGAVKFGTFTLASGIQSPVYVDLRLLVSKPSLLAQAAKEYARLLAAIPCDRIAGVPYAALPIGTAVSIEADKPLIYMRKEVKAHGLGKEIEGEWQAGERVVIIEDLITSGGSTLQTAEKLRSVGLIVKDVIVLIDREQGGAANLQAEGIMVHSVFKFSQLLENLHQAGLLEQAKLDEVKSFLAKKPL